MMKKGVAISPDDISIIKAAVIPPEVFDAVNELLALRYISGSRVTIKQYEIADLIKEKLGECKIEWLNFEDVYRNAGWIVEYDKPAYCESYDAFFVFRKK
jgi:hypothetical protein